MQLARSNALAADNVGLKAAIDATIGWQQSTDPDNVESVRMLVDIKTPATEVILADVMAQGVEMFAKEMHADISGDDAREFAAQLRKGVQS